MKKSFLLVFAKKHRHAFVTFLRLSLGIVFLWFGALKIAGYNPVYDLIANSMAPFLATAPWFTVLGIFEATIGILLISNKLVSITHVALFLHLIGTFSVFVFGWDMMFDPHFPVLNLQGEFVVKNLILVSSGLVVLSHEDKDA